MGAEKARLRRDNLPVPAPLALLERKSVDRLPRRLPRRRGLLYKNLGFRCTGCSLRAPWEVWGEM